MSKKALSALACTLLFACSSTDSGSGGALRTAEGGSAGAVSRTDSHPFGVNDMLAMERLGDPQVSPDGKWISFVERFHVYLAPFIRTGSTIAVGPGGKGLPIAKVSQKAGNWIHFSGDSQASSGSNGAAG